jgi:hypothetical protein
MRTRIYCVKNEAAMRDISVEEIVIAPFRYEIGMGCPACQTTEGFLIRLPLPPKGFWYWENLMIHCSREFTPGDRCNFFHMPNCDHHCGFSKNGLREFMKYNGGDDIYHLPFFVDWDNLSWADLSPVHLENST